MRPPRRPPRFGHDHWQHVRPKPERWEIKPMPRNCEKCGKPTISGKWCAPCREERKQEMARIRRANLRELAGLRVYCDPRLPRLTRDAPCIACGDFVPPSRDGLCDGCRNAEHAPHPSANALCAAAGRIPIYQSRVIDR